MKRIKFWTCALIAFIFISLEGCGPVLVSARLGNPVPPWFYPNRVESIRYLYFPAHIIYYDLSVRSYIYLNNGNWVATPNLPNRYNGINLRRSRVIRINNYFGDDIQKFHQENRNTLKVRSSTSRNHKKNKS